MSGAAQREELVEESMYQATFQATGTESVNRLKPVGAGELQREAAERLAAHRSRRAAEQAMKAALADSVREREAGRRATLGASSHGSARVREAVKARYEQSVSYREFLAAEADRALQQAQAEAEVAARNAKAVAEAQMQLLQELEQWNKPEPGPRELALEEHRAEVRGDLANALADIALGAKELMREPAELPAAPAPQRTEHAGSSAKAKAAAEVSLGGLTVRLFEDLGAPTTAAKRRASDMHVGDDELHELEQEIEFRSAPEFEPHVVETLAIPGNVIEFPRQLVASRKARPRLAEGPLRDEAPLEPQLRIFEVEPEQIATQPAGDINVAPEWQGLLLDSARASAPLTHNETHHHLALPPQTAGMELRLMAALVDATCIGAAFVAFAAIAVELTGVGVRTLPLPLLGASAAAVLVVLFVAYQMLFFSLGEATPGMRYARIGLCTFGDRNPSRRAMRRRVLATLLAACPLGLGLAWVLLDGDRLGWHDRMSRMYQRAY